MRFPLAHVLVLATLLLWCLPGRGASNAQLTGLVEGPTSAPIPGASVTLLCVDGVLQTHTSQNGSFVFDDVSPGAYELKIEIRGFYREKLSLDIRENTPAVPLVIRPKLCMATGDRVCGPDFPVNYGPPGAANTHLEGVIYHLGGPAPIANADVSIQPIGDAQPPLRSRSDRTGRFIFENVPAGVYDLKIAKRGYQAVEVKRLIKPRGHDLFIETSIVERGIVIVGQ